MLPPSYPSDIADCGIREKKRHHNELSSSALSGSVEAVSVEVQANEKLADRVS